MPACFICTCNFPSLQALTIHFRIQHKLSDPDIYRCGEPNCLRDFLNLKSFKNHFKLKHLIFRAPSPHYTDKRIALDNLSNNELEDNYSIKSDESKPNVNSTVEYFNDILYAQTMQLVSKLYDSPLLPRCHVQTVIDIIKEYFSSGFISILKEYVVDLLKKPDRILLPIHLKETSIMFDAILNPFTNFDTEYLRFKEFENNNYLIKPIEYIVGQREEISKEDKTVTLKIADVTAQFVPLRIVLKKVFELKNILNDVTSFINSLDEETSAITNIYQSNHFKNIIKHIEGEANTIILPLYVYFDDYESGNPLGSHSGIHKLGAVYVSIGTLPPKYSSLLENIFIALLFHSNDRKQFGNMAIFNILLKEIKNLEEEGIFIDTPDGHFKIKFVLTLILGDNLGLHSLLGFSESFSSNFNCRFCKISKRLSQFECKEDPTLLRTKEKYEQDILVNVLSETGIKEECIFNTLRYFHAVQNPSVDIMHDLYEGVCHYDMLHILRYIIFEANFFSVETINFRLLMFNFQFENSNRPPQLSKDFHNKKKLSMSSSEMLCFVRYFGLLVGDLIPKDDPVYKFYLNLRELIDLVNTNVVTDDVIKRLQYVITEHNFTYRNLFKDTLKPKHHHLVHYPAICKMIGPLVNISCMRYESKHRLSKMTANVTCSRKNITKSLVLKNQLKLCYRLLSNDGHNSITVGPSICYECCDLECNHYLSDSFPSNFCCTFFPKWILWGSLKFQCNSYIFTGIDAEFLPTFGVIFQIGINNLNKVGFLYKSLRVICFNEHFYAYEVEESSNTNFVYFDNLLEFPMVMLTKKRDGKLYIAMRANP